MAAGLGLPQAHVADFEAAFLEAATAMIAPEALHETIASDGELPAAAFHIHNACALRDGGPWGQGFPAPLFDGEFGVMSWRPVGTQHLKLELSSDARRTGTECVSPCRSRWAPGHAKTKH